MYYAVNGSLPRASAPKRAPAQVGAEAKRRLPHEGVQSDIKPINSRLSAIFPHDAVAV
jgi:hypothetical protein